MMPLFQERPAVTAVDGEPLNSPLKPPHLVAKLQLVGGQHDDVVVDGQHGLGLDFIVREEAVAQLVFSGPHDF